MKNLFLLIFLCSTNFIFAQEVKKKKGKMQIGIVLSPSISHRALFGNDFNGILEIRNAREIPKLGYSAGFNFCYFIRDNISVETGLQYSNKGYKSKRYDLIFGNQYNPLDPNNSNNGISKDGDLKSIYNTSFLDIPLVLNYYYGKKKIKTIFNAGLTANIFLNEKLVVKSYTQTKVSKGVIETESDYTFLNFSPTLGFGFDYELKNKNHFRVLPNFSFGVLKLHDGTIAEHLWQLNFQAGYFVNL